MQKRPAEGYSPLGQGSPRDGGPAVDVVGVSKRWTKRSWFSRREADERVVLSDVTFRVGRGEILAVLGENGAGKTTLLKIVAGLARPEAGEVRVLGCDAVVPTRSLRRRVAYAGGERGFYFRLTVRENLAFFSGLDGLSARSAAQRIVEVTRAVDIERELDRRFADLSTGVRQRLTLARALIADPQVLLLDEPTRALDPPHAADLRSFIRETLVERRGKTVIIATNLIDEALELGDRIAVLRTARLEFVDVRTQGFDKEAVRRLFGIPRRA